VLELDGADAVISLQKAEAKPGRETLNLVAAHKG
jgi:hypothetical protein